MARTREELLNEISSLKGERARENDEYEKFCKKGEKTSNWMIWLGLLFFPILLPIQWTYAIKARKKANKIMDIDLKLEDLRVELRSLDTYEL